MALGGGSPHKVSWLVVAFKHSSTVQSIFLSALGGRPDLPEKALQLSTSAQGQSPSCGFFCNGIAWLPVKDYHRASHILTDAYLLSHKRQFPEHLYTLASSDSPTGPSVWQQSRVLGAPSEAKKWATLPSSVLDLSLRNRIQCPSLGREEHRGWIWMRCVHVSVCVCVRLL